MTDFFKVSDNARSLASHDSLDNQSDPVTFDVLSADAARFPSSGRFLITIWDERFDDPGQDPNMEIAIATGRVGTTITIQGRAYAGTPFGAPGTPTPHTGTPNVALLMTAEHLTQLQGAVGALETEIDGGTF